VLGAVTEVSAREVENVQEGGGGEISPETFWCRQKEAQTKH